MLDCLGVATDTVPEPSSTITRRYGPFGNIFFRPMEFPVKGSKTSGHTHKFDHVTWVSSGSVRVRAREVDPATNDAIGPVVDRIYIAPAVVCIKKNWMHEFEALEDGTRADCIFALRDWKGEVAEEFDGSLENYT